MEKNKGITMVALVITIIVLLMLSGISIGVGNNVINKTKLENIKTNMLLIEVKAKEFAEKANFDLGNTIDTVSEEEKNTRIQKAKGDLVGEEIVDDSIFEDNIDINTGKIQEDNGNYIYYYKLTQQNLIDMGLTSLSSNEKEGWYIIRYDLKNIEVEIYNTKGFENKEVKYYSLNEIESIEIKMEEKE